MMHLENVGRRTLICAALITAVAGVFWVSRSPAQTFPDPPKSSDLKQQPGRYQIFMHPQFRSDQYLLDTTTGQVWQLVKFSALENEPLAWTPMTKLDNDADRRAFILANRLQQPSGGSTGAPAKPSKPTIAPPTRLSPQ